MASHYFPFSSCSISYCILFHWSGVVDVLLSPISSSILSSCVTLAGGSLLFKMELAEILKSPFDSLCFL